jgi:transposase
VAAACREAGVARSTFYAVKKAFEREGRAGLEPKARRFPKMPNAFSEEVIERILEMTRRFPSYSGPRIARKLSETGLDVSASGVRKIWKRYGLTTRRQRFDRLRRAVGAGEAILLEGIERKFPVF